MGIVGLLTTTLSLIAGVTNFGLATSAVRNIAEADAQEEEQRVANVVAVLRRLVWGTGVLGLLTVLVFAPWLSKHTFGSEDYTIAFRWLSVTLLLDQLTSGQRVLLQGLRKLQYLAKANVVSAFTGLLVAVPLYYYFRIDGIVWALIASSLIALIVSKHFANKVEVLPLRVGIRDTLVQGRSMLSVGFALSLGGLFSVVASYFIRIYIRDVGSLSDVGLYSAGFAIIGGYVGMVFAAMGTDYYPRLARVAQNNTEANLLVQQQAEMALLMLGPILCVFITFVRWLVVMLYSVDFLKIDTMLCWATLGMYFKAVSWALGYTFLAKGSGRLFFLNELLASVYVLILNMIGYHLYGLSGLGISFLLAYLLYFIQLYVITAQRYSFSFSWSLYKLLLAQFVGAALCFMNVAYLSSWPYYLVASVLIGVIVVYSLWELNKRISLQDIIRKFR